MDGITACQRIRALPGGKSVPIVFVTALRDVDTFDSTLLAGGDDFLTKPVRPADLVRRVRAALELRKLSSELQHHYDLIRQQRDDLMRLQLYKEKLTAFVVHDLKNPVSTIDLNAQLLLKNPSDEARMIAGRIREETRSLIRLITNLLDISRGDEGQLVPVTSQIELSALIEDVLKACKVRADAAEILFETEIAASSLRADPALLRRILENLIENAIKHAPRSGRVRVSTRAVDGAVEIRVADSGSGIPASMREKVFERFVQLEGNARSAGRGLGLAFCKMAVEAHGGKLWIEDANPGAVFCMSLPNA
jgi:signal transduction histidine kinase